jgi:hypothetical protein
MEWLIDSGASSHMTSNKTGMSDYKGILPFNINLCDKSKLQIIGTGNFRIRTIVDGKPVQCKLHNVYHVPEL